LRKDCTQNVCRILKGKYIEEQRKIEESHQQKRYTYDTWEAHKKKFTIIGICKVKLSGVENATSRMTEVKD
jgi:hypothetical protein